MSTTIATTLGTDALASLATDAILDLVLPGIGALIGSFLGDVAGSEIYTVLNDITFGLFGDLFGGGQPWEYQYFQLDTTTNTLTDPASLTFTKHTDASLRNAVASLSNGVAGAVNSVIATIGGQAALASPALHSMLSLGSTTPRAGATMISRWKSRATARTTST